MVPLLVSIGIHCTAQQRAGVHPNPLAPPCPVISILSLVGLMVVTGNAIVAICTAPAATQTNRLHRITGTVTGTDRAQQRAVVHSNPLTPPCPVVSILSPVTL